MNANTRAGALLRQAASVVDGARNQTHGDKERSFSAIAMLWGAYLAQKPSKPNDSLITPADVAAMMVLLKFARSCHGEHIEDHAVDCAGYGAIWGELREAETKPMQVTPGVDPAVLHLRGVEMQGGIEKSPMSIAEGVLKQLGLGPESNTSAYRVIAALERAGYKIKKAKG